jgi:hypothetical protein
MRQFPATPQIPIMKLPSVLILAAAALPFAGCDSIGHLFHGSHHDPAPASASGTQGENETRYWDPQRNQWMAGSSQGSAGSSTKPAEAGANSPAQPAPAPAPTPRAARATGVYNSATGKIEWQSGGYVPPAAPTPPPTKHWWWPF